MNFIRLFVIILIAPVLFSSCSMPKRDIVIDIESRVEMPDFNLKNLDNEDVRLSSFKGVSPVLLVFWATWCAYCLEEMPRIADLRSKYGISELEIMAIDIQESYAKVAAYAKRYKLNFSVLLDTDGAVSAEYGVIGVPTMVVIDKEGRGIIADNRLSPKLLQILEDAVS